MRFLQLLILLPFLAFSHGDDLYLLKGAKVFLGNDGFVVKDILVDAVSYTHLTLPTKA